MDPLQAHLVTSESQHPRYSSSAVLSISKRSEPETMDSWFYRRGWIRTDTPPTTSLEPTTWMIFMDSVGGCKQISVQLSGADHQTIEVSRGKPGTRVGNGRYRIRPGC